MKNLNKKIGVVVLSGLVLAGGGLASSSSVYADLGPLEKDIEFYGNKSSYEILKDYEKSLDNLPFKIVERGFNPSFFNSWWWYGKEKSFESVFEFMRYYLLNPIKKGEHWYSIAGESYLIKVL